MGTRTKKVVKRVADGSVEAKAWLERLASGPLTFGQMLESCRLCEEWSQAAMARKLGIPRQHLCDIEKGRRAVGVERAAKFARILQDSVHLFVALALEDQLRSAGLKMKVKLEAA